MKGPIWCASFRGITLNSLERSMDLGFDRFLTSWHDVSSVKFCALQSCPEELIDQIRSFYRILLPEKRLQRVLLALVHVVYPACVTKNSSDHPLHTPAARGGLTQSLLPGSTRGWKFQFKVLENGCLRMTKTPIGTKSECCSMQHNSPLLLLELDICLYFWAFPTSLNMLANMVLSDKQSGSCRVSNMKI